MLLVSANSIVESFYSFRHQPILRRPRLENNQPDVSGTNSTSNTSQWRNKVAAVVGVARSLLAETVQGAKIFLMRLFIQSLFLPIACVMLAIPANASLLGTTNLTNAVPDGGMTAILLGGALAVIAVVRRFVKR